jgi:hypothetical protein
MKERLINAYRDRSLLLGLIGAALLLVGVAAAFLGPVEIYCFYLFGEGGRFHYEGFGFGSLLFGIITWQIFGYYLIALLCLPLGYAHVRPRRWARVAMLSLLWCALIVGLPLLVVFLLMLSFKELSNAGAMLVVIALAAAYLIMPGLCIRFYRSQGVKRAFEARDTAPHAIERLPLPVLVLGVLFLFYLLVLHVPLFFNGIVPLFGTWLSDMPGFGVLSLSIWGLAFVTWGVWRQKAWAWWSSWVYFGAMAASSVVTLAPSSLAEILSPMKLPPAEMEILANMPLQGVHLLPFVIVPLALTLVVILVSKRHFASRVFSPGAAEPRLTNYHP